MSTETIDDLQDVSNKKDPYEGDDDNLDQDVSFSEYEISASPNDFNIRTLFDFIDSGIVKIPGFQRNYVWDIKRASKLIESLLIGIPIPQIFLYEEGKNKFIVIDGQQRYFTIYFFKKKRFPKMEKRFELRKIFDDSKGIPEEILNDNNFFTDFDLQLSKKEKDRKNKFHNQNYSSLSEGDRIGFDLRTIRNIIIKQNSPNDGDTVVFEIFNRLNSGGVNLKPQEIRTSLYHSKFYDMLYKINLNNSWRKLTPSITPDLNMKDVEILLRGFAMLQDQSSYKPSLTKYLNTFSLNAKKLSDDDIQYMEDLFNVFVDHISSLDDKAFFSKGGKFNISVYEAIFVAICNEAFKNKNTIIKHTDQSKIDDLKRDEAFVEATQSNTSSTANVNSRIKRAIELL